MQDNAAATWRPKCGADSSRSSSPWDCSNPLRTGCWEPRLSENRSTLVPKTWKTSGTTKYKTPFTVRSLGSRANGVSNCRCFRKDSSSCSHLAWRHPGTAWLHAKVHPCMPSGTFSGSCTGTKLGIFNFKLSRTEQKRKQNREKR